jgi:hypothetical protein
MQHVLYNTCYPARDIHRAGRYTQLLTVGANILVAYFSWKIEIGQNGTEAKSDGD